MTTTTPTRPRRPGGATRTTKATSSTTTPSQTTPGTTTSNATTTRRPAKAGRRTAPVVQPAARRTASTDRRPARPAAPPRMPFVLLLVGLLGGALVSLLLLNTVLAQDAFTLTELQRSNKQLNQQRQALQEEIAKEESPARLGQRAKELGMREPHQPAFVDAQTGHVVGPKVRPVPYPAAASAAAAGVVGVPGAIVPGDGGSGGTR